MHGEWYQWLGLGGLVLVVFYFGYWIALLKQVNEVEDDEG